MLVRLIVCSHCLEQSPDIQQIIVQMQNELGEQFEVSTLPCMAACTDSPAVLLDFEYLSCVTPEELECKIREHVASAAHNA